MDLFGASYLELTVSADIRSVFSLYSSDFAPNIAISRPALILVRANCRRTIRILAEHFVFR